MTDWVEGRVIRKRSWSDQLFSLEIEAPVAVFRAGQYLKVALDLDEKRIGRPYSLVNPPQQSPLEIYFNEVPQGPLSPRLSLLDAGDRVWVGAQAGGIFTLDQVPDARDLWLFATGTALGVYLSILGTDEPWRRFERVILVHGVRSARELSYAERIAAIAAEHGERFRFLPTLSREHRPGVLHGRISALLANGELETTLGLGMTPETSQVMLCGNAQMIQDMKALLEARGLRRNRRQEPGHYTTEQYH